MAPAGQPPVDGLHFVGHLGPGSGLARVPSRDAQPVAQGRVAAEALELRRQGDDVAEREEQTPLTLADQLAIELEVGDDGHGPSRERLPDQSRGDPDPAGGETGDVRPCQELGRLAVTRADHPKPLSQPPADASERVRRPVEPDDSLPVEVVGKLAQRPQQQTKGPPLLLGAVDDPNPPGRRRVQRRLGDVRARPDQLVLAGEEALEQLAGRLVAGGALVDPAEEDLHQHPGNLCGENSLHRLVEGGDVERLRVPKRRGPRARREGLVDVHEVERHGPEQPLESATDVQWKRRWPPTWTAGQGNALSNGENARVLPLQHSPRILPGLSDQTPALANRRPGLGRRDDQDPVAAPRELLRGPGDELVDLVPAAPRVGADLRDGKRLGAHRRSIDTRNGPRRDRFFKHLSGRGVTSPWPWTSSPSCPSSSLRRAGRARARTWR